MRILVCLLVLMSETKSAGKQSLQMFQENAPYPPGISRYSHTEFFLGWLKEIQISVVFLWFVCLFCSVLFFTLVTLYLKF